MDYIKMKYHPSVEIDELDLVNEDEVLGDNPEGHHCIEIVESANRYYEGEVTPINIVTLMSNIQAFKNQGATHVEIIHHSDHHGYILTPVEMRKANQEEVMEFLENDKKSIEKAKAERVAQLEAEIKRLKEL